MLYWLVVVVSVWGGWMVGYRICESHLLGFLTNIPGKLWDRHGLWSDLIDSSCMVLEQQGERTMDQWGGSKSVSQSLIQSFSHGLGCILIKFDRLSRNWAADQQTGTVVEKATVTTRYSILVDTRYSIFGHEVTESTCKKSPLGCSAPPPLPLSNGAVRNLKTVRDQRRCHIGWTLGALLRPKPSNEKTPKSAAILMTNAVTQKSILHRLAVCFFFSFLQRTVSHHNS